MKWNPFFFFLRQSYIEYRIHNLLEEGNFSHLEDRYDDSFDLTITCLNGARKHRLLVPSPRGEYDFDPMKRFQLRSIICLSPKTRRDKRTCRVNFRNKKNAVCGSDKYLHCREKENGGERVGDLEERGKKRERERGGKKGNN